VNDLYRQSFLPDLLIAALDRHGDRPAVHIDGDVLTATQMRDAISRYAQAFRAQGIVRGEGCATLIALVKDRKGSHHAPKSVDVVESIPMSPLGKPDKKALRARYWAGSERLIH
jgi:acyl-CoA synthetase (AMP-forming)/AMP-acid ligase II